MKNQRDRMIHEALRVLPYGLYVFGVRGKADGELNAMAVSWAMQCSFEPPANHGGRAHAIPQL